MSLKLRPSPGRLYQDACSLLWPGARRLEPFHLHAHRQCYWKCALEVKINSSTVIIIDYIMIMHYSVLYINWRVRACVTFLLCALCLVSRSQPVSRGPLRFGNSLVYCHTRFCSRTHRFSVGANELLMHYYVTGCGAH